MDKIKFEQQLKILMEFIKKCQAETEEAKNAKESFSPEWYCASAETAFYDGQALAVKTIQEILKNYD